MVAAFPSWRVRRALVGAVYDRSPDDVVQGLAPKFDRSPSVDGLIVDLEPSETIGFEDLAGLFASNLLNAGLISATIRQAAYLYRTAHRLHAKKIIEIGRYRGGSTILLAAAAGRDGRIWSVDNGEEESRLSHDGRPYDDQVRDLLARYGLHADLIVGDSRTVVFETGPVDLVYIDGDHSYDGTRCDVERYGSRLRPGGALLLDDAVNAGETIASHARDLGLLVDELQHEGFMFIRAVDQMAHLERIG